MFIASTYTAFQRTLNNSAPARGNFSGQLYRFLLEPTASFDRIYLPPAIAAMGKRPSGGNYGNRQYLVGGHTANLIIDEDLRAHRQGMQAPNTIPDVSVGAGSTLQICYTRFYDEVTGERSPLSDGKEVTGDENRTWSNLPTQVPSEAAVVEGTTTFAAGTLTGIASNYGDFRPGDRIAVATDLTRWAQIRSIAGQLSMTIDDTGMVGAGVPIVVRPYSRASHIELWVSVFGVLPRLAIRVRIGTTSVVENVSALSLGIAETISFGEMPRGEFSVIYNDRQLIAGVDGHRDTVYLSAIGFPERNEGLAFRTKYNEPIVGLARYRDYVIVLCPDSSYRLQGYTEDDYVMTVLEPDIGGLGHHGNAVAEGRLFIPGRKGVQIFNGAFHPAIPTRRSEWSRRYHASKIAYEEGFVVVNPNDSTYQFYPRLEWIAPSAGAVPGEVTPSYGTSEGREEHVWVGDYGYVGPQAGGAISTPEWTSDTQLLSDTTDDGYVTAAAYLVATGEHVGVLARGTSLGKIYVEDESDPQSVPFVGESVVASPHILFGQVGGGIREGKTLIRLWSYFIQHGATTEGRVRVWPGDEFSYPPDRDPVTDVVNIAVPSFESDAIFSGELVDVGPAGETLTYQKLVVRNFVVKRSGRGFTVEHRWTNPLAVLFLGFGGTWGPGDISRPVYVSVPLIG